MDVRLVRGVPTFPAGYGERDPRFASTDYVSDAWERCSPGGSDV